MDVLPDICAAMPVHRAFGARAASQPDQAAIVHSGSEVSYDALDNWSNALADDLLAHGFGPGERIGLCAGRSPAFVAGVLAILKAGSACVPLDADYPPDRLSFMLRDSAARAILGPREVLDGLPVSGSPARIALAPPTGQTIGPPREAQPPGATAFIIYTSGSTGQPKGVSISHAALAAYVAILGRSLGVTQQDRYLHAASVSFSSSNRQLLLPLTAGSTLVMAGDAEMNSPLALAKLVRAAGVTIVDLVPSRLRSLAALLTAGTAPDPQVLTDSRVRLMLSASEPLHYETVAAWRRVAPPPCRILNMYGMTETCGIVSLFTLDDRLHPATDAVPIGHALDGVTLHLRGPGDVPVRNGEAGELWIEGPTLAEGYLGGETGFVREGSRRLYRTGDCARRRPDGNLELLGRRDQQIKIDGIRIEPAEIEHVLASHPGVRDCMILPSTEGGRTRLQALYVAETGATPDEATLAAHLGRMLPSHMIPARLRRVDALPRTLSGKLRRIEVEATGTARDAVTTPRSADEARLLAIWSVTLGRSDFGVFCNFHALGGTSLDAQEISVRILQAFGVSLHPAALFRFPCIVDLALHIRTATSSLEDSGRPAGSRVS